MNRNTLLGIAILSLLVVSFQNCGNSRLADKGEPASAVAEEVDQFFESVGGEGDSGENESEENSGDRICELIKKGFFDEDYSQKALERIKALFGCGHSQSPSQEEDNDSPPSEGGGEDNSNEKIVTCSQMKRGLFFQTRGFTFKKYSLGATKDFQACKEKCQASQKTGYCNWQHIRNTNWCILLPIDAPNVRGPFDAGDGYNVYTGVCE